MRFEVDGIPTHASTGGRSHKDGLAWVVFVHGAGFSHLTWLLQTRSIAYDDVNVLAPDLPGHYLSEGEPLTSVTEMAEWMLKAMDAAGCEKAILCGHSLGGLIALEMTRLAPERVDGIVFVATADAIPVNPQLIETADTKEHKAFEAMMAWAHGPDAHMHENTWPGGSHIHSAIDVMGLNKKGALAADLKACAAFGDGETLARVLPCPSLCVFAAHDKMTPLKAGKKLASFLPDNEMIVLPDSGHTIPTESPRELTAALRDFIAERRAG